MKPILTARGIRKRFTYPHPLEVLCGIDLELHAGQAAAIVGRSGEGKSTLLHILATLEEPTSGTVEIAGQTVTPKQAAHLRSQKVGMLFQAYHLLEEESVLTNVLMPAWIRRFPASRHQAQERARHLIEQVGLSDRIDHPAKLLSGGEKQRVALARALCNEPCILLADEPTGNLDQASSAQIHQLLLEGVRGQGHSLLVVTHDMKLAQMCDVTYQLSSGVLI